MAGLFYEFFVCFAVLGELVTEPRYALILIKAKIAFKVGWLEVLRRKAVSIQRFPETPREL
jgi:hypothetical protein